jgi:hypothetical protein
MEYPLNFYRFKIEYFGAHNQDSNVLKLAGREREREREKERRL